MADENGALSASRGLADVATDKDKLFRDGYIKGIAEFIKGCATPMTIAIQGDWGAGKTSLINLIDMELRARPESPQDYDPDVWRYCSDTLRRGCASRLSNAWWQACNSCRGALWAGGDILESP